MPPRSLLLGLALAVPATAGAQAPAIQHKAVACIVAEQFPRMEACFDPVADVARARVHFRAHGTGPWYFVDMTPEGACHAGTLPKPRKTTKKVDYYVEVMDRRFADGRTPEHDPRVVVRRMDCRQDMIVAAAASAASIVLGAAVGAPPIPVGFASDGIVGVAGVGGGGTTAPATSGGGPAVSAGKGGGGGGTAAAFLLGAGLAGGGAYYLTHRDDDGPAAAPSYDGTWTGTTSQGRSFTFTVAQNAVVRVDTSYQLAAGTTIVPVQRSPSPGLPIANGTFTLEDQAVTLTGTFASETSATGTLVPVRSPTVTWQATRR
jgi:hypothetical protein